MPISAHRLKERPAQIARLLSIVII